MTGDDPSAKLVLKEFCNVSEILINHLLQMKNFFSAHLEVSRRTFKTKE
jgi:hypothetical protein